MVICPNCGDKLQSEDNRCDTDRGTFGSIIYWCDNCGKQFDEDINED